MAPIATGGSQFENIRDNLNSNYAALSDAELESVLTRGNINADAMEGFFDDVGKFAANAAATVLPVAGRVIGTVYGGPAGAAIGGQLGSLAGGAIAHAAGVQRPGTPAGAAAGGSGSGGAASGSPAAGQLLQTIMRPETLQALASMAMGAVGKPNVAVGGTPVPISAFSNLLGTLAGRAEAEYNAALAQNEGAVPRYLQDYAGEAKGDPAIASDRAEALYELLGSAEVPRESAEAFESAEFAEALGEWESEADAAELLELVEAYESEDA